MPASLSPEVESKLTLLFSPDERNEARTVIEQCGKKIQGFNAEDVYRLQCAVLKLSDGKVWMLRRAIDLAKIDFRDVLMAADFGDTSAHMSWWPEKKW
jgi:hypothetical protein